MAVFAFKTKNNDNPNGKPRVYFTCHPQDFARYFEKITGDIFKTHNCAIYYTQDMSEPIDEEHLETDLGQMNLFVVPVTALLLTTANHAMDNDLVYAKKARIPILPFMMESGLDRLFSQPEKFGELQYLNPNSSDITEISYEEKLRKCLDSVLISDEMAARIRAAFDAYIFLSYRKKDRRYANELMKLIHRHPECRDIAIWFDEFLSPGENFMEGIQKALERSSLFTLLVTPNLLEEVGGKPNFVMEKEYPAAKEAGKDIFPVEMQPTDHEALAEKFPGVPECVDPNEEVLFRKQLLQTMKRIAITPKKDDPEHTFLIGLAYLDGIDMEVNRQIGLELIEAASEAGLPEAMEKLYNIYIEFNRLKATHWGRRLLIYYRQHLGEEHPTTLAWLLKMSQARIALYRDDNEFLLNSNDVILPAEEVYQLHCKVYGEAHPDTLAALFNLAGIYSGDAVNYGAINLQRALELYDQYYELLCASCDESHLDTIRSLHKLACALEGRLDHSEYLQRAVTVRRRIYQMYCDMLGEKHPDTLASFRELAWRYLKINDFQTAQELFKECYRLHCEVLGQEHAATLSLLDNMVTCCNLSGDHPKALELQETCYALRHRYLGHKHPDTLVYLHKLAYAHKKSKNYTKALELYEKCYALRCEVLGEKHPDTLSTLFYLAWVWSDLGDWQRALELTERCYRLRCEVLGENHLETLTALNNLACIFTALGDYQEALELHEKCYRSRSIQSEYSHETRHSLTKLIHLYEKLGYHQKAAECKKRLELANRPFTF